MWERREPIWNRADSRHRAGLNYRGGVATLGQVAPVPDGRRCGHRRSSSLSCQLVGTGGWNRTSGTEGTRLRWDCQSLMGDPYCPLRILLPFFLPTHAAPLVSINEVCCSAMVSIFSFSRRSASVASSFSADGRQVQRARHSRSPRRCLWAHPGLMSWCRCSRERYPDQHWQFLDS